MRIFKDTKVYIICPGNFHSGGPELLHQLCSQLIKFDVDAYMFYISSNLSNPVDSFYVKYHCPYVLEIEDKPHNILIIPETANGVYFTFKRVRKIFWWLSVDNYLKSIASEILKVKDNILARPLGKIFYIDAGDTEHWVQSEYARQFLKLNGVPEKRVHIVEDYLNLEFLIRADKINLNDKQNRVIFNIAKGFEFTQQIIKMAEDIQFIPIFKMTPEQVQNLLATSKVYIDFGNHPGKDRIPREAAISGCIVITGKRGAAANNIDINIPDEFKFGETEQDLPKIIDKIRDAFENFDNNYSKQADYRTRILDDKNRFANEVATVFNVKRKSNEFIALAQGLTKNGYILADILASKGVVPNYMIDDRFCNPSSDVPNDFIQTRNNTNYFYDEYHEALNTVMIISSSDAKFLYSEGRINKFALLNPYDTEIDNLIENFNLPEEDIFVFNINI